MENKMQVESEKKSYLVTGGSGFIGRKLCQRLIEQGHQLTIVTRNTKKTAKLFSEAVILIESLSQLSSDTKIDIIINLAGEPLAASRWNKKSKQLFIESRVSMTQAIKVFIDKAKVKPTILISGSAIGFYGLRGDEALTEIDPGKSCYSHHLCKTWETEALKVEKYGVRVCLLRTGIVLGQGGGPLASLLPPFKLGLGGRIGHGKQWMSWIHLNDLIRMVLFAIENKKISGPINGVSPNPLINNEFCKVLGQVLKRPVVFPMPAFVLRLLIGEMADELLIHGQKVLPEKAVSNGFDFQYPALDQSLKNII